jgi:hypothetical protein
MLYREIFAVCSEIHTKHINTLCGQNVEFVNVKPGGTERRSDFPGVSFPMASGREGMPNVALHRYVRSLGVSRRLGHFTGTAVDLAVPICTNYGSSCCKICRRSSV